MTAPTTTPQRMFPQHNYDSAPEASKPTLQMLKQSVGMIPNLAAAIAESPRLIEAFCAVRLIWQSSEFTPAEREIISLTNAVEHGCNYCRAIHSAFALQAGVPPELVHLLRNHGTPSDPRLKALVEFARATLRDRGHVAPEVFERFFAAGYSKAHALDVLLALTVSVIANYGAHFTRPTLDEPLRAHA